MEKKGQELRVLDDLKSEEFVVDDLLDFSNGEFEDGVFENLEYEIEDKPYSVPISPIEKGDKTEDGFASLLNNDLCIPVDEVADLEWLSHFVEDSSSGYSVPLPVNRTEPVVTEAQAKPVMETPVQTKVRSKRGRTGFRLWSLTSPLLIESHSSSSSTSSSSGNSADALLRQLPPTKRQRKKAGVVTSTASCGSYQARRCRHCGVQKTPQWRGGPTGPKTLCNACGVRYKSGRLLPEYRPACSPTFSSEVHSNNHRKVLEMRRQKEVGAVGPASGLQGLSL